MGVRGPAAQSIRAEDPARSMGERCRHEIADIEAQIRAGHPDLEGLCLPDDIPRSDPEYRAELTCPPKLIHR